MDDRVTARVTTLFLLISALAGAFVLTYQQRRIDTLGRLIEILEKDSVEHGARIDAQTTAETEAFRRIEAADRAIPSPPHPAKSPEPATCPECGLKQYPPPANSKP